MKFGDLVKGIDPNRYGFTNDHMTKGVVTAVDSEAGIWIKIIEHTDGATGVYFADPEYFEVIGRVKPFDRDAVFGLIGSGNVKAIFEYDLRGANLSDAILSGADMRGANLRGADLSGAILSGADMSRAILSRTNLSDASLRDADMSLTNLRDAILSGVDMRGANLSGTILRDADMRGAILSGANLSDADMRGANLRGADLSDANLDFGCWALWCGSLEVKVDKRVAAQLAYHFCRLDCDDPDYVAARNSIVPFANQFHGIGFGTGFSKIRVKD